MDVFIFSPSFSTLKKHCGNCVDGERLADCLFVVQFFSRLVFAGVGPQAGVAARLAFIHYYFVGRPATRAKKKISPVCTRIDLLRSCEKVERRIACRWDLLQPNPSVSTFWSLRTMGRRRWDGAPGRSFQYRQAVGIDVGYVTVAFSLWSVASSSLCEC